MTRNLAFVVSCAYEECKLRSILLKCARAQAVHAARLGMFCRPFEYSGLTPCIVANQHLSWNFCLRDTSAQGYVPDPPSLFSLTGGSGDETSSYWGCDKFFIIITIQASKSFISKSICTHNDLQRIRTYSVQ